ncbi:MAG TPA: hypothetical protein VGH54_09405 [Mycobacterium sp.]|jgi:hypothetical protein|uniref:hypothetical protein n=1 Tax=Mycobacterium sp. TaxID=1785 RepID=UPI002F403631
MANEQKLKLTLKNVVTDREWKYKPMTVTADPDDHRALRGHMETMARDLDRRSGRGWLSDYTATVEVVDQSWRKPFTISGGN